MRRGGAAANLALACASILVALLLAEIGLRLFVPPPAAVRIVHDPDLARRLAEEGREAREVDMPPVDFGQDVFVRTPTGRRLRANMHIRISNHRLSHRDVEIRTNSLGYRGPEIGPKTRTRILFLGDSITMAHYLPEEETFVRRVEALSAATTRPLETINAGIAATGLQGEVAILSETGLGTDPDVVVVDYYLNDVQASPGVFLRRIPGALAWSRVAQHVAEAIAFLGPAARDEDSGIDPTEFETWRRDTALRLPPGPGDPVRDAKAFHRLVLENFDDWGSAWSAGAWERMRPLFLELRRQADARRFRLAFVAFPVRLQVEAEFLEDAPQARLKEVAAEIGAPVLDLLPVLRRARVGAPGPLFYDICHPTTLGNALIAEAIEEFLQKTVLGPSRPGQESPPGRSPSTGAAPDGSPRPAPGRPDAARSRSANAWRPGSRACCRSSAAAPRAGMFTPGALRSCCSAPRSGAKTPRPISSTSSLRPRSHSDGAPPFNDHECE